MNIAIIGAGNVGGTLAKAFQRAGHKIFIGSKDNISDKKKADRGKSFLSTL